MTHYGPKCQGSMEPGFILELSRSGVSTTNWVEGRPVASWLFGLRLSGRRQLPTQSFRCKTCGFLETYAKED
jgi:hypothetical protein